MNEENNKVREYVVYGFDVKKQTGHPDLVSFARRTIKVSFARIAFFLLARWTTSSSLSISPEILFSYVHYCSLHRPTITTKLARLREFLFGYGVYICIYMPR